MLMETRSPTVSSMFNRSQNSSHNQLPSHQNSLTEGKLPESSTCVYNAISEYDYRDNSQLPKTTLKVSQGNAASTISGESVLSANKLQLSALGTKVVTNSGSQNLTSTVKTELVPVKTREQLLQPKETGLRKLNNLTSPSIITEPRGDVLSILGDEEHFVPKIAQKYSTTLTLKGDFKGLCFRDPNFIRDNYYNWQFNLKPKEKVPREELTTTPVREEEIDPGPGRS